VFNGGADGSDTVSYRNVKANEGGVDVSLSIAGPQNTQASGIDSFVSIENLEGSVNDDRLVGNSGNNKVDGSAGDDTIYGLLNDDSMVGGLGDDLIDGGLGRDWAIFLGPQSATVNLNITVAQDTGYGMDRLTAIENVGTGDGDDVVTGNGGDNSISTGFGVDSVDGGAGADEINGGAGADLLKGGAGADIFVFDIGLSADNIDRITDFVAADDTIHLDSEIFDNIATGTLKATDFQANATAAVKDASDRIIYETDTGNLYYDADGNGSAVAVQFAVIQANLTLTAADFFIF